MIHRTHLQPTEHGGPGDAELQTDVMRFFALLAICLVALMSLAREPVPPPAEHPPAPEPETRTLPPPQAPASRQPAPPQPAARAPAPPRSDEAPAPAIDPVPPAPAEPAPDVSKSDATAEPVPLELRFASTHALQRLEASGEVRIFAVAGGQGHRWSGRSGRFEAGRLPDALWLMDPATVPPSLKAALGRATAGAGPVTWGVTLSPTIQARLNRRLGEGPRGVLLIDAAGNVVLQSGENR